MFIKEGFIKEGFIRSNPSNLTNCGGNAFVKEGFIKEGFIKSDGSCGDSGDSGGSSDKFIIKTITIPTSNAQSQSEQKILSFLEQKETNNVKLIANLITPNAVWVIPSAFLQSKGLKTYENKSFDESKDGFPWMMSHAIVGLVEYYQPTNEPPDSFTLGNRIYPTTSDYSESYFIDKDKKGVINYKYYDLDKGKIVEATSSVWDILFSLISKAGGITAFYNNTSLLKEGLIFPKIGGIECVQIGSYLDGGVSKPLYEKVKSGQEASRYGDISISWNYPTKKGVKDIDFIFYDVIQNLVKSVYGNWRNYLENKVVVASSSTTGGDSSAELSQLITEVKALKKEYETLISKAINNSDINNVANKVLEVLEVNGVQTINYNPTIANVAFFKDGEKVNLPFKRDINTGSLRSNCTLNGEYVIVVDEK